MANIIGELKEIDRKLKSPNADAESVLLDRIYHDSGRIDVLAQLQIMRMGVKEAQWPLIVGMLRRVVDRLAVVYAQPATRWLRRNDKRLPETDPAHLATERVLKRAQLDLALSEADKLRALHRTIALRVYPSDPKKSVVLRPFGPMNILRDVDPSAADTFDGDRRFALCISCSGDNEVWETWTRVGEGWKVEWISEKGDLVKQPFGSTADISPYGATPPVLLMSDAPLLGRPYLPPRSSRIGFSYIISALANDLLSLAVQQAHSRQVYKKNVVASPGPAPESTAHGGVMTIDTTEDFQIVTPQPAIAAVDNLVKTFCMLFLAGEDLPLSDMDPSKGPVTGPALMVLERPLQARREQLTSLADEDERLLYERLRSVHNAHAEAWGAAPLDETTELEVEVADVRQPTDPVILQKCAFADIAAGLASSIDYICARDGVPRHVAIANFARIQADRKLYPADTIIAAAGQKLADVDPAVAADLESKPVADTKDLSSLSPPNVGGAAELMGKPSVVSAMRRS